MRLRDYISLGWDQLKRRMVVTLLCAMGIAIGSAAIIVALAFGESITHYAKVQMNSFLKMDEINVSANGGGRPEEGSSVQEGLTAPKIELIRNLPHVRSAALFRTIDYMSFRVDDSKQGSLRLVQADLDKLAEYGFEFGQGSPSAQDNAIVITYASTFDLFDTRLAQLQAQGGDVGNSRDRLRVSYPLYQKRLILTQTIADANGIVKKTNEYPVRVVAVLKKPEGTVGYEGESIGYISEGLAERIMEGAKAGGDGRTAQDPELVIKVDQPSNVAGVEALIRKLNLQTQSNIHYEKETNSQFRIIRFIFGGAGAFILFVASISIVVAMTMSTYQRRRQIGIMKVLGANLKQIRNMFIVESALLGVVGGLAGILFSYWVIWAINIVLQRFAESDEILFISLWILPVGLLFALLTGVASGIYPAVKASRTDALTAIKRD